MASTRVRGIFSLVKKDFTPLVVFALLIIVISIALNTYLLGSMMRSDRRFISYVNSTEALNELMKEHLVLLTTAIKVADTPESAAAVQALESNTTEISVWIGTKYDENARYEFQTIWRTHIEAILAYSKAAKDQNSDEKAKQLQKISGLPNTLTEFFLKVDPEIQRHALKTLLDQYSTRTKTIIDTYRTGDFVSLYRQQHESLVIMNSLAQVIAKGTP